MELFHRYEGHHVAGCFTNKPEFPRGAVWYFGKDIAWRRSNGHKSAHHEMGVTFLVGRCNNTQCPARVFVRAGDISAYLEEIPF
jgi:hypothetical protein